MEEINLRIDAQKRMYPNPLRFWGPRSIIARLTHPKIELGSIKKWYLFERFLKKYIHHTKKEYHSWKEIFDDLPVLGYDAVICGGDQIWNVRCVDFSESYYLPSNLCGVRKLSYSPSMGGDMSRFQDEKSKEFIKKKLQDFDILSVRDRAGQIYLEELLNRNVPIVPDPAILLTREEWESIIPEDPIVKGDYILYYSPFSSKKKEDLAILIGQQLDCKILCTNAGNQIDRQFECYNNCGPIEFLNILKNAKYVCGNSYHLVVFSLLFHKEFIAFGGDSDARIVGLLSSCGIEERGISMDTASLPKTQVDYSTIDSVIAELRAQGKSFIGKMLL